jgi:hypothetical protein
VQKYFDVDLSTGAVNCTPAKLPGVVVLVEFVEKLRGE